MNQPYRIDAEAIAGRINPSARRSSSGWWPLPGICHDRRDRPTPRSPRQPGDSDGSDVVSVKCWAGCDRDSVRRAIEGATGWRIWGQRQRRLPCPTYPDGLSGAATPARPHRERKTALGHVLPHRPGPRTPRPSLGGASAVCTGPLPSPCPSPFAGCRPDCLASTTRERERSSLPSHRSTTGPNAGPTSRTPTCIELVHLDAGGFPALDRPSERRGPREALIRHPTGGGLPAWRPQAGVRRGT